MKREMTDLEKAARQALEALENHNGNYKLSKAECIAQRAVEDALRQALEQPAQQENYMDNSHDSNEPVAWRIKWPAIDGGYRWTMVDRPMMEKEGFVNEALYTRPQAREWVGLTDEERKEIYRQAVYVEGSIALTEAKLREKNT